MLPLLLAALGAPGAAPFVLQVASFCSLATDGSLVATNGSQEVEGGAVAVPAGVRRPAGTPRRPLPAGGALGDTWGHPGAGAGPGQQVGTALRQRQRLCQELPKRDIGDFEDIGDVGDIGDTEDTGAVLGPLGTLGDILARALAQDSRWGQRLRQRQRLCQELPKRVWPPLRAPPRLRIVPERSGPALALTCYAWGFSPADITMRWLHNGDIIGDIAEDSVGDTVGGIVGDTVGDTSRQSRVLPVGDGTFRAQATIQVPPGTSGDTFDCVALHPSLEEPLRVTWAPGLSPRLSLLVALAVLALLLGLLILTFGLRRFLRAGYTPLPGATHAGYTPLPGDTYAGSI
ncbi:HLA class II histocompatibility antigen, DM beta chain [Vidua macroura]|uniref:HLA class II histocompatibility antigen, DM beta chain n=1 Tax=Vidua macroura TaxID=187451 RepID=UPI0023A8468E|nr:HLA class II histocompatibility antigen, DM beta chain [Vidua macroura]